MYYILLADITNKPRGSHSPPRYAKTARYMRIREREKEGRGLTTLQRLQEEESTGRE